jgi:RimJ/RimL family protein N-acetyltransferase
MNFSFEPLNESHFHLLLKWLQSPHVKEWWPITPKTQSTPREKPDLNYTLSAVREKYGPYTKGYASIGGLHKPIFAYIIHFNQTKIGYIQIYKAYDFPRSKPLLGLPTNLGAFDIFIGEITSLGQNLGSKAILEFLSLHGRHYSHIFADPDSDNQAAIKSYAKAGFKKIADHPDIREIWMLKEILTAC